LWVFRRLLGHLPTSGQLGAESRNRVARPGRHRRPRDELDIAAIDPCAPVHQGSRFPRWASKACPAQPKTLRRLWAERGAAAEGLGHLGGKTDHEPLWPDDGHNCEIGRPCRVQFAVDDALVSAADQRRHQGLGVLAHGMVDAGRSAPDGRLRAHADGQRLEEAVAATHGQPLVIPAAVGLPVVGRKGVRYATWSEKGCSNCSAAGSEASLTARGRRKTECRRRLT